MLHARRFRLGTCGPRPRCRAQSRPSVLPSPAAAAAAAAAAAPPPPPPPPLPLPAQAPARLAVQAIAVALLHLQLWAGAAPAAELIESTLSTQGNGSQGTLPTELSAAGEAAAPRLSSLFSGDNKKQIEKCTRRCVPTCIRGGEGAPGLGPLSLRKDIVVFKDGFRSRSYCLSECAQVCSLMINKAAAAAVGPRASRWAAQQQQQQGASQDSSQQQQQQVGITAAQSP